VSYLDYYGKLASKILKCTVHHHYHIVNRYDVLVNLIVIICVGLELELHYFQSVDATSQLLLVDEVVCTRQNKSFVHGKTSQLQQYHKAYILPKFIAMTEHQIISTVVKSYQKM